MGKAIDGERLGVLGTGVIAQGVALCALERGPVLVQARSAASAGRAREAIERRWARAREGAPAPELAIETGARALAGATFVIEAISEDLEAKSAVLGGLDRVLDEDAIIATTTSSLSVTELARCSGRPRRFAGLHFFNPVAKMALVELAFPDSATPEVRRRAHDLCVALGKEPVEVPDEPGFIVNRLLFPYLFEAVRLGERLKIEPVRIDACMRLGAGNPMGPLELLDRIGLDVALAIGDELGLDIPLPLRALVSQGKLGRKTAEGFYPYGGRLG